MMKRHVMVLSLYDLIHHLKRRYEFDLALMQDLVELVAYCQIDSVRANGVESIYSNAPAYISPLELIDEDLRISFSSLYPKSRYHNLLEAAVDVWQELPSEDLYWRMVSDIRDPKFHVRWRQTDLILELS